jgi:hypothetical protein
MATSRRNSIGALASTNREAGNVRMVLSPIRRCKSRQAIRIPRTSRAMNHIWSTSRRLRAVFPACARAQSLIATLFAASLYAASPVNADTRDQVAPELDAFFKLDGRARLFLMGSATRAEDDQDFSKRSGQYKNNAVGANLDYTLQPFLRTSLRDEDWEHNRFLWMRVGYQYLGKFYVPAKAENRVSSELDARQPLPHDFSLTGRLKWDIRDIASQRSDRYGVRLGVERPFSTGERSLVPYVEAEALYDTRHDTWNQHVYQAGIDIGINKSWRVEPYVNTQDDSRSEPAHVYAIGLILKYYH